MKKKIFGKKLKRDTNERAGLFKSLISSLVINEQIKTTKPKAQAIRSDVEKLVTKLKNAENELKARLHQGNLDNTVFTKLYKEVAPRFKTRNGGYTRIIKMGKRVRDNAEMVVLEWVEKKNLESQAQNQELKSEKLESTAKIKSENSSKKNLKTKSTKTSPVEKKKSK